MARSYKVGVLKGDGVGPEIVEATIDLLNALDLEISYVELEAGYNYYRKTGRSIEEDFFDKVREVDAILKGPLYTPPDNREFKSVNILIRRELDLYANVRPFRSFENVSLKNFNIVLIRENTEDVYVGIEGRYREEAISLRIITGEGSRRIARYAFNYAVERGFRRVTVVHKANILKETDGLFRETFYAVSREYPNIIADELIVDTAAYSIVKNPERIEMLLAPNLYGDILADLLAGMVGSLGLCGSAQIGDRIALFEPVHGVALDIAGRGIANPIGEILSAKMMLEYLGRRYSDDKLVKLSERIEEAVHIVVGRKKIWTPDLGGTSSTKDVAKAIEHSLKELENVF
ncbi:MAG: isocitrate/isopropylmalate dehydrogenase family protein [Ignisphaera sp.]|nr:isocitrate/isopropylmalate dehydrogenase family protein [Ignisphaera sp.]MCX8167608.1 isocitrate/isopropylmalate dehydrogenase family protein [Ignisphaera sp.]MDW8086190.1 isocitrate/isopropylmalate dehydrogenase family protein [Ignisphaera sp.]